MCFLLQIRSKAPRYSFNLNPKIFEDEGESLQQEFQVDTEGTQPAVLRFYKNIRAEVVETAEQLKNLKTTALRVAGIEEKGDESFDRVESSQDNERSYDNRMVTNSNMLTDMMRKRGDPATNFSVEDTSGNQMVQGTTKAWLQNQQQEQNHFAPSQSTQSWPQQNQVRGVRPSLESFGPPQSQVPGTSQFSQTLGPSQLQMPLGRPFPGMRQVPESFVPMPSQTLYGPSFPGPIPQNNARPMNQPLPTRPSDRPNIAAGLSAQSFLPRGFQQQVSSMPQPPAPNWSAQRPMMPPGNFAQMPMGLNEQNRFNTPGMMLPPSGGMMVNRQQPGLGSPASQVPPNFTMPRMQAPPPLGASGPQKFVQRSPMSSQIQQQMMRPQAGAMPQPSSMPPMQARMPPQMSQQNFPGSPQMASAQQNFRPPPILPMTPTQQTFTRPPQMGLAPQNFNRPPPYAAMPRMAATQFGGGPPLGAAPQRPR